MLPILGIPVTIPPGLEFLLLPEATFFLNLAAWILVLLVVNYGVLRGVRFFIRRLPGEWEDTLFGILRVPLLLLILLWGVYQSTQALALTTAARDTIRLLCLTALIIILTHVAGRTVKDVIVFYGGKWARKTETQVDDILIPVLNLFSPILLVLTAGLIILPLWGFDISTVLVGAGVMGLVLGLALQDPLSNIFSGLSLLVESPFRTGDLITLPDGRVCEVQRIGIRSTQLYSISEHSTVYVPNRSLAAATLTNITKPTVDQKFMLEVPVTAAVDIALAQEKLLRLVKAHPAVLVSNMDEKIPLLREQIRLMRDRANALPEETPQRRVLLQEAQRNEDSIPRLELEGRLNQQLDVLLEAQRQLIRGIRARESNGLSEAERQEIYCNFVSPVDHSIREVIDLARQWSEAEDPWLDHSDYWDLRYLWKVRNEQLQVQWDKEKKLLLAPDDRLELRLDDLVRRLIEWIQREYKVAPAYWKNPSVTLKQFDGEKSMLQIWFHVDNIRLEHYNRPNRARSEIARQVREALEGLS